jgi:hypothetical protein
MSEMNDYNFGLEGVNLMFKSELLHQDRLSSLEKKQADINHKLSNLNDHLKKTYKHLKSETKHPINLTEIKENVLKLWNEWKEDLKKRDLDEYNNLKVDLEQLDFSKLTLEHLDDKLIPELEKVQKHYEFKYQKIPNELRMFIELFTILVEILKEFPKKQAELGHHAVNAGR